MHGQAVDSRIEPALAGDGGDVAVIASADEFEVDAVAWSALIPRTDGGPTGWQAVVKRSIDVIGALVLLVLASPVLAIAALGVRISSDGPILFRQTRVGRYGRPFTMDKFRTFPVHHVDITHSLSVEDCPLRWGRLLRRTSIDELPQLLNVLRGDMSLVGPRPERPRFSAQLAKEIPSYRERHRAPVGITGLAQVRGFCGPTSIDGRVGADNEYIDGWTIGRDFAIVARTVPTLVRKLFW